MGKLTDFLIEVLRFIASIAVLPALLGRRIFRRVFGNDSDGFATGTSIFVDEAGKIITEAHAELGGAFLSEREHVFRDADRGAGVAHLGVSNSGLRASTSCRINSCT